MPSSSGPTTPAKKRLAEKPFHSTPFISKLASNPAPNKKVTVPTMSAFLKEELGDSRLFDTGNLLHRLFPDDRLPISVDMAVDALISAGMIVMEDEVLSWAVDLIFLWKYDTHGTSEMMLRNFLTKLSDTIRAVSGQKGPASLRRWSTVAASKPLREGPSSRKPDIVLSSEEDKDITNENVISVVQLKSNPDDVTQALDQVMGNAFNAFSTQSHRRFFVCLTICGHSCRLYNLDHSGLLGSLPFNVTNDLRLFIRILIGLVLCPRNMVGYDLTVFLKDGFACVEVEGHTYRLLERIFHSEVIRGRGTVCWRAVREDDPHGTEYAIKDTWADTSRESERAIMSDLKGLKGLPTLVAAEDIDNGDGMDTTDYIRSQVVVSATWRDTIEVRQFRRYVFTPYGNRLSTFASKRELLSTVIDAISAHGEMLKKDRLHRDVSYGNILINRVEKPYAAGLLIDLEYSIKLSTNMDRQKATGHRTGTLPFMAVNILSGRNHEPRHDLESFYYVLVWMCIFYEGPNDRPRRNVSTAQLSWVGLAAQESPIALAARKSFAFLTDDQNFQEQVLVFVAPYFNELLPCLSELRQLVIDRINVPTHQAMIDILRRHMDALSPEAGPPSNHATRAHDTIGESNPTETQSPVKIFGCVPRLLRSHIMVTRSQTAHREVDEVAAILDNLELSSNQSL